MANTHAVVTQLEGQAWIRGADGNLQALRVGMQIPLDAQIVTGNGSNLVLQGNEDGAVVLSENQQLIISSTLFDSAEPQDAAIQQPSSSDVDALITALNAGQDPMQDLEATEATLKGGEGAGSTYVRLANVIENTNVLDGLYGD